jgi:hypothetical protein
VPRRPRAGQRAGGSPLLSNFWIPSDHCLQTATPGLSLRARRP